MKKIFACALALVGALSSEGAALAQTRAEALSDHVHYLASDELRGRRAGSEEAQMAREYIIGEFNKAGLVPFFKDGFREHFQVDGKGFCNAVGMIEGSDPELKNEYVVLGAHFDHLGERGGKIYPGVDDNASGSAALIEIAKILSEKRDMLKRSVIFAGFDAEEIGLHGSNFLAKALADSVGVSSIKLMMSLDMVGYYRQSGKLILQGSSTIKDGKILIEEEANRMDINVKTKPFENSIFTATDTDGFARKGIATLAVTTGLKSPYHKPEDVADSVDYAGLDKVTGYISEFTVVACDPYLQPSGKVAPKHIDKRDPFMLGVDLGIGGANMMFKDGGFQTYGGFAFSAGVSAKFRLHDAFGFKTGAYFERATTSFPIAEDLYYQSARYGQSQFTVPLEVMAFLGDNVANVYAGLGAYYSHALNGGIIGNSEMAQKAVLPGDIRKNQFGIVAEIGFSLGAFTIGLECRNQLGNLFKGTDVPRAQLRYSLFKLGYNF